MSLFFSQKEGGDLQWKEFKNRLKSDPRSVVVPGGARFDNRPQPADY